MQLKDVSIVMCRNIPSVSSKINSYELGHTSNTRRDLFLNIYFLQESVEITKEVIDNKDDLTNNDKFNAPGPSLNDKVK